MLTRRFISFDRQLCVKMRGALLVVCIWSHPWSSQAQEAARISVAGAETAQARRADALTADYYNLNLGPARWNVATELTFEGNDNIRFESNQTEADLVVRPRLATRMAYQLTDKNALSLALETGYSAYVTHPEFNRFFIAPGSELSLDFYLGDFWFNVHERLSVTEDQYADPTVFGTGDYSQLRNTTGLNTTWDLNAVLLTFNYDHANYIPLTGGPGLGEGDSDTLALSSAYRLNPTTQLGAETGAGVIGYGEDSPLKRALNWNVGAFLQAQPMEYVSFRVAAGYTVYAPDSGQASDGEFTGLYARIGMHHRVNQYLEYNLNAGRNITFGFFAGTVDLTDVALEARWHLFKKLSLGTGLSFEHGAQVLVGNERFDRYGPHVNLERSITTKMSGTLRYQYYQRQSALAGGDYAVNIVTLSFTYRL